MFRANVRTASFIALLLLGSACGDEPNESEKADLGTVAIPLISGSYRLNASLIISGTQPMVLTTSNDPSEVVLSAQLPPGEYQATLSNWALEREETPGMFVPVYGELVTSPSSSFTIFNGTTTTLSYRFNTETELVSVGTGALNVEFDVVEQPSACTPFVNECAQEYWCAPGELTGAPLACIPPGTTPVWGPCQMPTDCVAYSTCMEAPWAVESPLCLALCPPEEFGLACPLGGTCQPVGVTYGVCRFP